VPEILHLGRKSVVMSVAARRYLLGQASEQECAGIERDYFVDEAAGDGIAGVEEALIEDYLAGRLAPDENRQFERHYLASPRHRQRVELIRHLGATAPDQRRIGIEQPQSIGLRPGRFRLVALAATVVITVGTVAALWGFLARRSAQQSQARSEPQSAPASRPSTSTVPEPRSGQPASSPQLLAFSLSPTTVRSASDSPSLVIPAGTEVVSLQLEREAADVVVSNPSVVIQRVGGGEVWRGNAEVLGVVFERVDVPAAVLIPDDYAVVLSGSDQSGVQQELSRYFLRVRAARRPDGKNP
jgi:hypothetical protein